MMKLQAFWRVAFLVLFQFIARKGSGGVFAADFLSQKKSGEQFPGAAACDKKLLALLFPEAYDGGSDSAAGQDNAAHQRQTAAAFGNSYISIPFDNPQLQTVLNCYKGFPTYMMPNVDGDSSVMPKNHGEFLTMVKDALEQEIEPEPEAPSGGDAPLATPAATTGTGAALVTRTSVREAISREKAKAEKQGKNWQPKWTPQNWSPEKFHFVHVTEMVDGLKTKVTEAVDWATRAGRGEGDDVEGILTTTQRTPAVVNVVYQIWVEPAGVSPGQGPNKVRSNGCESEALEDLRRRRQDKTLDHAQQIICKSDLWTLVHLWSEYPTVFLDDGHRHGEDVGGLQSAGRGATSKARTTWRLEFVLPRWLSHKSEDFDENGRRVTTYTAPKESFRSEEERASVQRALPGLMGGDTGKIFKIVLKAKEGGQFSNTPEPLPPGEGETRQEQTLLLLPKEFAGTGTEATDAFRVLFTTPRWDRRPNDLPPKAALVIGSPAMDKAVERFRRFESGSGAMDNTFYDEHMIFYDSLNNGSIENIVPEWRLFGNWLNDGEGSSKLFQSGITELLNKGPNHHQGIPYKQSHDLALAAPTKEKPSSFCLAGGCVS